MKNFIFVTISIILCSCSINPNLKDLSSEQKKVGIEDIVKIASNWEYKKCPNDLLTRFSKCDFEIPLPKDSFFDAENAENDYFWIVSDEVPLVQVQDISIYQKMPFSELINCGWLEVYKRDSCPTHDFLKKIDKYEIARRTIGDTYDFFIRTPKMTLHIIDPSDANINGPSITEKNLAILEKSLTNLRIK